MQYVNTNTFLRRLQIELNATEYCESEWKDNWQNKSDALDEGRSYHENDKVNGHEFKTNELTDNRSVVCLWRMICVIVAVCCIKVIWSS